MIKESCHTGHKFAYKERCRGVENLLKGHIEDSSFAPASLMVNLSNIQEAVAMQMLRICCVQ